MLEQKLLILREIFDFRKLFFNHFDPYNDMAQEPTLVGIVYFELIIQFFGLADIMKYGTGNQKVPVDSAVMGGNFVCQGWPLRGYAPKDRRCRHDAFF